MCWSNSLFIIAVSSTLILTSCNNPPANVQEKAIDTTSKKQATRCGPLRVDVLTAEEQSSLSPDSVIKSLREGNERYVNNLQTIMDPPEMVRKTADGQYPKAVILSCLDSRVPVEEVFNGGVGDIFVARIAGNFINDDILGSMEYGCKESGAKLIVVLGHESCGAIKGAIDKVKLGNLTGVLAKIKPAIARSKNFAGDKTSKNDAYVEVVAKNNIEIAIANIRAKSPILAEMERKGEIKIVGAYYSVKTGLVSFLPDKTEN